MTGDGEMPRKKYDNDILTSIAQDYKDGVSCKDISQKYHIDFYKLKKKLIENGMIEDCAVHLSYDQLVEISQRYRNGERLKALSIEYKVGIEAIKSALKKNNLYFKKYENIGEFELNCIVTDYKNGLTPKELSIKYKRSDCAIIYALRRVGVYIDKTSRWNKDEIEILKKYYPIESIDDITFRLPRHPKASIIAKACSLRLKNEYSRWMESEIAILKNNYGRMEASEIAKLLNYKFSVLAIRTKAQKMGFQTNPFWTEEECNIIRKYYPTHHAVDLCKLLPNKSPDVIREQARKLNVKNKLHLEEQYSKQQINFIKENWDKMSDEEIGKVLNKTPAGIMAQRNKYGLYKIKKDYSNYYSLDKFFRGHLQDWKTESISACNYQCILTGSKDFAIHHIYSFNSILKETYSDLDNQNLLKSNKIEDYTKEQLDYFLSVFLKIHSKYPLGVCVRKDIHNLFHKIYGAGGNNQAQWDHFVNDFKTKQIA